MSDSPIWLLNQRVSLIRRRVGGRLTAAAAITCIRCFRPGYTVQEAGSKTARASSCHCSTYNGSAFRAEFCRHLRSRVYQPTPGQVGSALEWHCQKPQHPSSPRTYRRHECVNAIFRGRNQDKNGAGAGLALHVCHKYVYVSDSSSTAGGCVL